jgi:branched-chain amino acid transport system ATP-binding protein
MAEIEVDELTLRFGGLRVLDQVSLRAGAGELLALVGPNGAGKTSVLNCISGIYRGEGAIRFRGQTISGHPPREIARLGIARTFQVVQPFPKMTVLENAAAGALFSGGAGSVRQAHAIAREHLEFTGLADMADRPAAALTLARRKRLELAKSLAMKPRLLMLDEVNAGLNPTEIAEALDMIRKIASLGVTIIVIEHLMKVVLSISHRLVVLHHGQLIAQGEPRAVVGDKAVIEAYLGSKYAAANPGSAP